MDEFSSTTLERPELPPKPRGSCLVVVATLFGLGAAAFIAMLLVGFLWPLIIGFSILGMIGLQYLLWGWWLERIYRSQPADDVSSQLVQIVSPKDDGPGEQIAQSLSSLGRKNRDASRNRA
jgi:hypothetical protein